MPGSRLADLNEEAQGRFNQLALEVRDALSQDNGLTVGQLAENLDASEDEITFVLEEYRPQDDGTVRHEGPGLGGNWVPQADPPPAPPEVRTRHDIIEQDLAEGFIDADEAKRRHEYVSKQETAAQAQEEDGTAESPANAD